MNKRWKRRPKGSTSGDWGDDDQRGRLNLLTPERFKQAAAEVREGLRFCLSMQLDMPGGNAVTPKRFPPKFGSVFHNGEHYYNFDWTALYPGMMNITSDECITLYSQYSTQWDSLAHVGCLFDADADGEAEPLYYKGYRAGENLRPTPATLWIWAPRRSASRIWPRLGSRGVESWSIFTATLATNGWPSATIC